MGVSIRIEGANFASALTSLTIPNRQGLVQEYILGKDADKSARNRAAGGVTATVIGAPIYSSEHFATVGAGSAGPGAAAAGFDTGLIPNEVDNTFIAIARRDPLNTNYSGVFATPTGWKGLTHLGGVNTAATFYNQVSGNPPVPASVTAAASAKFRLMIGWGTIGAPGWVTMGVAGALVAPVAGTANGGTPTSAVRIGGDQGSIGGNGRAQIAYAARFARILTAQERSDIYESLKAFYAGKIDLE